jgi:hypothetical protein
MMVSMDDVELEQAIAAELELLMLEVRASRERLEITARPKETSDRAAVTAATRVALRNGA